MRLGIILLVVGAILSVVDMVWMQIQTGRFLRSVEMGTATELPAHSAWLFLTALLTIVYGAYRVLQGSRRTYGRR